MTKPDQQKRLEEIAGRFQVTQDLLANQVDVDKWTKSFVADIQFLLEHIKTLEWQLQGMTNKAEDYGSAISEQADFVLKLQKERDSLKEQVEELKDKVEHLEPWAAESKEKEMERYTLSQENTLLKSIVEVSKTLVSVAEIYSTEHNNDFRSYIKQFDSLISRLV